MTNQILFRNEFLTELINTTQFANYGASISQNNQKPLYEINIKNMKRNVNITSTDLKIHDKKGGQG